jgi:hypothetical protein
MVSRVKVIDESYIVGCLVPGCLVPGCLGEYEVGILRVGLGWLTVCLPRKLSSLFSRVVSLGIAQIVNERERMLLGGSRHMM